MMRDDEGRDVVVILRRWRVWKGRDGGMERVREGSRGMGRVRDKAPVKQ